MCDVHLIESIRERRDSIEATCAYCEEAISGPGIRIEGVLDDGSPGVLQFSYHEDCVFLMEFDQDEIAEGEGCFSYGRPTALAAGADAANQQ